MVNAASLEEFLLRAPSEQQEVNLMHQKLPAGGAVHSQEVPLALHMV